MTDDRKRHEKTESEIAKEQELAEQEEVRELDFVAARERLINNADFKMFMREVFTRARVFNSVMTGNSQTYYLSGRQDFGREIFSLVAEIDEVEALKLLIRQDKENSNAT